MKKYAIIVAGGKGTRMNSEVPKQFLELDGIPILVHTISRFLEVKQINIIVVIPKPNLEEWNEIDSKYFDGKTIHVVEGGSSRSDSVRNGLNALVGDGLVAIHDGARPFITKSLIENCFDSAEKKGSGVAMVPLKDSVRERVGHGTEARNRENYFLVQTPQTFLTDKIKTAFQNVTGSYPDDATIFELAGNVVHMVEGDYSNIKITTPEDLK